MNRRALTSLFSVGLALATTRCGGESRSSEHPGTISTGSEVGGDSASDVGSASASATVSAAPPAAKQPSALAELRARLKKVDYVATTQSGFEYVGFVTFTQGKLTCPHGPCPKEWAPLVKKPDVQHLIMRKDGKLVGVTAETYVSVLGPIETPAEAVMLVRLTGRKLAGCNSNLLRCRHVNDGSALVDTGVTDAFMLATHAPGRCPEHEPETNSLDLRFIRVDKDGKISGTHHALVERARKELEQSHGPRCPPRKMRGRRFEGYRDAPAERSALEYLVRAHLEESAAVVAFERLAADLARFDAPASLVMRARAAARDERRHAAVFLAEARALAARLCAPLSIPSLEAPAFEARSLEAVLLENAVEGCANETGAAIVATHQATAWPDVRLRPALERIASDERTHAALAYDVHAWGQRELDPRTAARVEAARVAAVALAAADVPSPFARALGEPDPAVVAQALQYVATTLTASS